MTCSWRLNYFGWLCEHFLGNIRSLDFEERMERLLKSYAAMGHRMLLKVHFLHSYLDVFAEKFGAVSDEQGERFRQGISSTEHQYQGLWNEGLLADYCWILYRDKPE